MCGILFPGIEPTTLALEAWSLYHWATREVLPGPLPKTAEADAGIKAGMIPLCLVTAPKEHPGMRERGRQSEETAEEGATS